jgi:hypothetical protein
MRNEEINRKKKRKEKRGPRELGAHGGMTIVKIELWCKPMFYIFSCVFSCGN